MFTSGHSDMSSQMKSIKMARKNANGGTFHPSRSRNLPAKMAVPCLDNLAATATCSVRPRLRSDGLFLIKCTLPSQSSSSMRKAMAAAAATAATIVAFALLWRWDQ